MTGKLDKARAVFLAALMVVSVFGGTMAFAGTAAAAVNNPSLNSSIVPAGGTVTVSGTDDTEDTGSVNFFLDLDDSGNYTADDQRLDATTTDSKSFEQDWDINADIESGTYDVYVTETESFGTGSDGVLVTQLTVDGEDPTFGDVDPDAGTTVTTSTPEIDVALDDDTTSISESTIMVNIEEASGGDVIVHQINEPSSSSDGIQYDGSNVTVDLTAEKLQSLPDGTYDVTVSVEDESGRSNSTTYSFTVDTQNDIEFSLENPADDDTSTSGVQVKGSNQPITVNITADDGVDTANITAYDENGNLLFRNNSSDSVYGNTQFDITPKSDISSLSEDGLPNGTVTLELNATDNVGHHVEDTLTFTVDNGKPAVESVETNVSQYYATDTSGDIKVTADFDESVDASSVNVKIVNPDETNHQTLSNFAQGDDNDESTVVQTVELADSFDDVENGSIEVVVTSGADLVGNSADLTAGDNNTTLALDTVEPTITFNSLPPTFDGLMDLEQHVSVDKAVSHSTGYRLDSGRYEFDNPSNVDVDAILPEGYVHFNVSAMDANGTTVYREQKVSVDAADPSVTSDGPSVLTGEFNVSDIVTVHNNGTEIAQYGYQLDGSSTVWSNEVTAEDGMYTFVVKVNDPRDNTDSTVTLTTSESVEGNAFQSNEIVGFSSSVNNNDAGELNVTIETESSDPLTGLNVTVKSDDNYHSQNSVVLTREDFVEIDSSSNNYVYKAQYEAPRDGQYDVAFNSATNDAGLTIEGDLGSADDRTVNNESAKVVDADLVNADESSTTIRVEFSEPVSTLGAATFGGENVIDNKNADSSLSEGYTTVVLDDEYQTGGDKQIAFGSIENNENVTETSADVTYSLDLSEGLNVVSIPAETGGVALDDLNLDEIGVDSVMEYDATNGDNETSYLDEWAAYDAQTSEGQLQYLEGGDGYVIVANESTELDIEVKNVPRDGATRISQENLEAGWNLVGAFQEGSQNVDQAFSGLTDQVWSVQTGYSGDQPSNLEGGQGYWLSVNKDAVYVPVDYTGAQSEQPTLSNVQIGSSSKTYGAGETIDVSLNIDHDVTIETVKVMSDDLGIDAQYEASEFTTGDKKVQPSVADPVPSSVSTATVTVAVVDAHGNIEYARQDVSVDSQAPTVSNFAVTNPSSQDVKVSFTTDEQLSSISATVSGAEDGLLSGIGAEDDFAESETDGTYTYEATYSGAADGEYTITLDSAIDANGNDGASTESDSVTVDTTGATVENLQLSNDGSGNLQMSFDSNEQLGSDASDISVSVDGPSNSPAYTFDGSDFSGTENEDGSYTYTLTTTQAYNDGTGTYTASVDKAIDTSDNSAEALVSGATHTTDAPSLQSSNPSDGASSVDSTSTSSITLTFSEAVTVSDSSKITLQDTTNSQSVDVSVNDADESDSTVTVDVTNGLSSSTDYTLTISAGAVTDNDGDTISNSQTTVSFTTSA